MIRLQVIDGLRDHFIVTANEPMRIEVSMSRSGTPVVIAHIYRGEEIDKLEPVGCYDGTLLHNSDWIK